MRYIPHTAEDVARLLSVIGVETIDELFAAIPPNLRFAGELDLPAPLDEQALTRQMNGLAARGCCRTIFAGGGAYRHYIPAAIDHLLRRSEFYTAYTPYQPEISQGTLQAIFEFQTMIARLLAMEVANASMYDGASAVAEAALMAKRVNRCDKVLVSAGLHPQALVTLRTYTKWMDVQLVSVPLAADGRTDLARLAALLDDQTAGVIVQSPNYLGVIENAKAVGELLAGKKALFIQSFTEALAFGLYAPPGEVGADIACGDGQSLGIPLSFGGPHLGLFATTKKLVRQMPGRVCGQTIDAAGDRAYCLTLSTREQHIRREKATSNICTNHALCALAACVYMALIGKQGLRDVAQANYAKAEYLKARLAEVGTLPFAGPTFNEFAWIPQAPADKVLAALDAAGIFGGLPLAGFAAGLDNAVLTCVTEANTREEIDRYVEIVRSV
ncbi:MAG TPA: aminomethyl-transferring glycine dehydrogenase subunit GcvPA [bacterium]|nr:aminomethyl-transferring glycine dehydrogenase subunit GcvPA [bacterium]